MGPKSDMNAGAGLADGNSVIQEDGGDSLASSNPATQPIREKTTGSKWLSAWDDPVAGIKALSSCVRLADLNGDGDAKLLIADADRKLKLYKGTVLISEHALLNVPTAICTFFPDKSMPRTPALAVASGPHIFIYRNLRPYYKFSLPVLDLDPREVDVWQGLRHGTTDADAAYETLMTIRDSGASLTSRSLDLLATDEGAMRLALVEREKPQPLSQQTVITCMETLKKNVEEEDAVTSLVVGTESRYIMILDPSGSSIIQKIRLPSVPLMIAVSGLYEVEYRLCIACRDSNVYMIKNNELTGTVIELESQPVGIVRCLKSIVIGCMGNVMHSYHIKGKKNYSVYLPAPIVAMELLSTERARSINAVLVAMADGELRVYNEKNLVSTLHLDGIVTGLRFGKFAREDNTLVLVMKSGGLSIKILPRTSSLEKVGSSTGPPPEQDIPLAVPKKTKLYVEQTQRERDQGIDIHRVFQRDLCKLRLATARAYVKVLTDGQGPLSYTAGSSLRLSAQVQGLGPIFKLKLAVQNTGNKPITNTPITLSYSRQFYFVRKPTMLVPMLVPGPFYKLEVDVECLDPNGSADPIRVFVCNPKSCAPIITATVNMPISELLLDQ